MGRKAYSTSYKIFVMLEKGKSNEAIIKKLGVTNRSIGAVKANITRGSNINKY